MIVNPDATTPGLSLSIHNEPVPLKFIDLFAGLGGFHIGLKRLNLECVFASEINTQLASLYEQNFAHSSIEGDIKKVGESAIPSHDLLCAGFPCQPFSKAGGQEGLSDVIRGNLFYDILRIAEYHRPKYMLLENVANLKKHDRGNTWRIIQGSLEKLGYQVSCNILSPHQFGIPQIRQRMFIVACRTGLKHFKWPEPQTYPRLSIHSILDEPSLDDQDSSIRYIPKRERTALEIWQRFLDAIPSYVELPSFPIWATEFEATYPYETQPPAKYTAEQLDKYKGAFGKSLDGYQKRSQLNLLPSYARGKEAFPDWKKQFIRQNREFFDRHRDVLRPIMEELQTQPFSWQKFEWNCKGEQRQIKNFIIQFRPSGIRVKRPTSSPALVAFTKTQVPIIGWEYRYMTKREGARLQSLGDIILPDSETAAFRALGNAVNANLVEMIAQRLLEETWSQPNQILAQQYSLFT